MKRKRILLQFMFTLFALTLLCACAGEGGAPASQGGAAALTATGPGRSVTDWPSGVTLNMPDKTFKGYTLYTSLGGDGTVNLIDMRGNVVHTWKTGYSPGMYAFLLPNGNLVYCGRADDGGYGSDDNHHMSGKGGVLVELDWSGKVVTKIATKNAHHDMEKMPNGDYLVTLWEPLPAAKRAQVRGGVPGTEFPDGDIFEEIVAEFNPQGKMVWSWKASDHMSLDEFPVCAENDRLEWLHVNSVRYLPADNPITKTESIMCSFRQISTCVIFEKSTGKVQWRYGGELKGEYGRLGCQHDFRLIDKGLPGEGHIMIFDNGMNLPSVPASTMYWGIAHSRILEIDPQSKKVVWMYEHKDKHWDFPGVPVKWKFNSPYISGSQRLANGNTLICDGAVGRLFEVTHDGEIVWEYINPEYKAVFRANRYAPNFPGFAGKGLPPM